MKLRVRLSTFFSIIFALFTAPIGLPGVPSFLFLVNVTVIKPSLDYEELGKRILSVGVLNIGISVLIETRNSLVIVLRVNFARFDSCALNGHIVDHEACWPPSQAAQLLLLAYVLSTQLFVVWLPPQWPHFC